jgi:2'-5' RNA ligase
MRLFIAVVFEQEIKSRLLYFQNSIKEQALKGNFSRVENLHLTLVFFGETPQDQIPPICSEMEKACLSCASFSMDFGSSGFFTHSGKELWWIGSDDTAGIKKLRSLKEEIAKGLRTAGVIFDERPFRAHITLGREIRLRQPVKPLKEKIVIPIDRINLMKSEHINRLLVYTEIASFRLTFPVVNEPPSGGVHLPFI